MIKFTFMENINSDFYKTLSFAERIGKFDNVENYFIPSSDKMMMLPISFSLETETVEK